MSLRRVMRVAALFWLCLLAARSRDKVLTSSAAVDLKSGDIYEDATEEPSETDDVDDEDGEYATPKAMEILVQPGGDRHEGGAVSVSSVTKIPASAKDLLASIKQVLSGNGGRESCLLHGKMGSVGSLLNMLPPGDAMRSFGVYQMCKQCTRICGAGGRYLGPRPKKFCLIDIQGCTAEAVSCPKPFAMALANHKPTFVCQYSRGCWCKFKRAAKRHNVTVERAGDVEVDSDSDDDLLAGEAEDEDPGWRKQNRSRVGHRGVNHHHHPPPAPRQPWIYENRVTIALLSVWLFCAVVYVGYNYKCVADACFGWMPCYQRLVGVTPDSGQGNREDPRRRIPRGRSSHMRRRRTGSGQNDNSSSSSSGSPATPPRAHRARQMNVELRLTTTSLPKYEDVVLSDGTQRGRAAGADGDADEGDGDGGSEDGGDGFGYVVTALGGDDCSPPTYEQATSLSIVGMSVSRRSASSSTTPVRRSL